MKQIAVAFSGPSNSGKTTLIVKITKSLIERGFRVVVLKHDPKDKGKFDIEGKDSFKFSQAGADVVVASPSQTTYFCKNRKEKELDEIVGMVGEFDYLLVEGLKTLNLPRISLFKGSVDESYLNYSDAIATDELSYQTKLPHFRRDDVEAIISWIDKNGKKIKEKRA
ncbi:molybdopterin-guanine dinucleotide biosynthesis protein B [uncultured Campylobacter sp.]|uniref:molybdopterin-guanine dinucleotide biosynthesis protein B n=1 Tax=uncultured Campylobacter sp. TaxID=218934 RepID=UPI002604F933|nr:molybdopterin-guanine dinucleotide biosynthesis protein B [uncultured Campylobacter sp.]